MANEKEETPEQQEEESGGGKSKMMLMLIVGVVLIAISGLVGAFLGGAFSASAEEEPPEPEIVTDTIEVQQQVVPLKQMEGERKQRYVRFKMTLGIFKSKDHDPAAEKLPDLFMPKFKDKVRTFIKTKTLDDMKEREDEVKAGLIEALSEVYPPENGKILEVYITELLLQ